MAEFTLFEIHLDDASIEGSADGIVSLPFSSVTRDDTDDDGETEGSTVPVKLILLLVLAVAIAALVRRRRSDRE
ncbi:hypothetical protein [Halapricum hydrolyticum]|uniref:Uncharacterized protein n=1 Tax=Halapricum hydrolyticum TaxID=2979991 RepID=A0AAE3LHZ2_9EURY|nr:hypothetical protein [Halapricum hydrolyticum]MCU4716647.1 hypothetical protein [Halapricum hydrolyticum]MCU4725748.1 hypothetical protein [Halapricum hydrolyticum]